MRTEVQSEEELHALEKNWSTAENQNDTAESHPNIRSVSEIQSVRSYGAQTIDYVIEGLIAEKTVTAITGESGSGKSTFMMIMASAVERGVAFSGRQTKRHPVLVLDRENPLPIVIERMDRLGINDSENFKIWGGWAQDEAPDPCSPIVLEWVAAHEPKPLIVADSLIAFHPGNENDASETRRYLQGYRRLADMGATVVILHHSGKAETAKDYRGSSDIKGAIDVGYHLANLSSDPSRLTMLRLRAWKARFSVDSELILHYNDGAFRIDERGPIQTTSEVFRDLLIAHPSISLGDFEDLAAKNNLGRNKARSFLADGIASGNVRVDHGVRNARFHTWDDSVSDAKWGLR